MSSMLIFKTSISGGHSHTCRFYDFCWVCESTRFYLSCLQRILICGQDLCLSLAVMVFYHHFADVWFQSKTNSSWVNMLMYMTDERTCCECGDHHAGSSKRWTTVSYCSLQCRIPTQRVWRSTFHLGLVETEQGFTQRDWMSLQLLYTVHCFKQCLPMPALQPAVHAHLCMMYLRRRLRCGN